MKRKVFLLIVFFIILSGSVGILLFRTKQSDMPSEHSSEASKKTSKVEESKSILTLEQSEKQDTEEGISPMTIEEVSNQITPSSKGQVTESVSDESFEKLQAELSQLSLKEIIPRLADMKVKHLRQLLQTEWYAAFEKEVWELSTEEQMALIAIENRAFPEETEQSENLTGLKTLPPGYTYIWKENGTPELIKYNEPYVSIDPKGAQGYENWHQLTDAEYRRYLILNAISSRSIGDLKISREVAELAKAWKQPLYEKSWGYIPSVSVKSIYLRKRTPEDEALEQKLVSEADAKIQANKPKTIPRYHANDVKTVVNELKTALNQR